MHLDVVVFATDIAIYAEVYAANRNINLGSSQQMTQFADSGANCVVRNLLHRYLAEVRRDRDHKEAGRVLRIN
jgi:hypothetical protein